jgi:hypothetical protein
VFVDAVDREAGVARLIREDGHSHFTLPAALLPDGAGEGAWIEITLAIAPPPAQGRPPRRGGGGDLIL